MTSKYTLAERLNPEGSRPSLSEAARGAYDANRLAVQAQAAQRAAERRDEFLIWAQQRLTELLGAWSGEVGTWDDYDDGEDGRTAHTMVDDLRFVFRVTADGTTDLLFTRTCAVSGCTEWEATGHPFGVYGRRSSAMVELGQQLSTANEARCRAHAPHTLWPDPRPAASAPSLEVRLAMVLRELIRDELQEAGLE